MSFTNNLDTHNGLVGKIGEDFASDFLKNIGHTIVERNFRNKIGEIDIISLTNIDDSKRKKLHIVEVKTSMSTNVRAEENMNRAKMLKVGRLAEIYMKHVNKNVSHETLFCIDFIGVYLNPDKSLKEIKYIENLEIY